MDLNFDQNGLIPAVVQEVESGEVLMVAWMNSQSLALTFQTGVVHFWSRRRKKLWRKGETSGNIMTVRRILKDCDGDTLLIQVSPAGPVCHTGANSCFFTILE